MAGAVLCPGAFAQARVRLGGSDEWRAGTALEADGSDRWIFCVTRPGHEAKAHLTVTGEGYIQVTGAAPQLRVLSAADGARNGLVSFGALLATYLAMRDGPGR